MNPRWLHRSARFMSAIKEGDFSRTVIAYHPGVITMWIAGLRTFFTDPGLDVRNLARARFFIGIFVWIGIGAACLLLYRLFGQWVALASFACFVFSPLFLAQTRRVHTDALASIFILLTLVLLLIYCQNRSLRRYLVCSGIAFGLALLSKSYALILLICFPFLPILVWICLEKPEPVASFFEAHHRGRCFPQLRDPHRFLPLARFLDTSFWTYGSVSFGLPLLFC